MIGRYTSSLHALVDYVLFAALSVLQIRIGLEVFLHSDHSRGTVSASRRILNPTVGGALPVSAAVNLPPTIPYHDFWRNIAQPITV